MRSEGSQCIISGSVFGRRLLPSARQSSSKQAATIVNATAKTRSVIEGLQARLQSAADLPEPSSVDSMDDLERELQAYFHGAAPVAAAVGTSRNQLLDELKDRVIDGVVDRIIAEWSGSQSSGLGREVMDRLIERVLQELGKNAVR